MFCNYLIIKIYLVAFGLVMLAVDVGTLAVNPRYCSSPKMATLSVVATNTLPSATVGTMNLLPAPN